MNLGAIFFSRSAAFVALLWALIGTLAPGVAPAQSVADELSTLVDEQIADSDTVIELWRLIEQMERELDAFDRVIERYQDDMTRLMLRRSAGPGEFGRLLRESSQARVDAEQRLLDLHMSVKALVPQSLWPEFADVEARAVSRLTAIYLLYGQAGARSIRDYIDWVTPELKAVLQPGSQRYGTARRTLLRIEEMVAEHNKFVRAGEAEIIRLNQSYDTPREAFQSVLNRLDAARSKALREILQYRISLRYMFTDGHWQRVFKPGPFD